jgi:hypothetical protein
MARIKSALELALERTEGVKSDKETLKADAMRKEGKKLASDYLQAPANGEAVDLQKRLKAYKDKDLVWVREGIAQVFLANLILPADDTYTQRYDLLAKGILELVKDKKNAGYILKQIGQFFSQYRENQKQITQNLERQYAPKLRQKEAEISRQMGAEIHLSPQSDPEFVKLLKGQYAQLESRYQEALLDVKKELEKLLDDAG